MENKAILKFVSNVPVYDDTSQIHVEKLKNAILPQQVLTPYQDWLCVNPSIFKQVDVAIIDGTLELGKDSLPDVTYVFNNESFIAQYRLELQSNNHPFFTNVIKEVFCFSVYGIVKTYTIEFKSHDDMANFLLGI